MDENNFGIKTKRIFIPNGQTKMIAKTLQKQTGWIFKKYNRVNNEPKNFYFIGIHFQRKFYIIVKLEF